jgi:4-azaleucine resistance transporter AzlC
MIPDDDSGAPSDPTLGPASTRAPSAAGARRDGVVLGLAVGVFGVAFGVLAVDSGLSVAKASAMSLLVFTGASQFAAVSVVGAGGTAATALAGALLLALRNGVYGLALDRRIDVRGPRRLLAAQLVIDESTAMATAQPDRRAATSAFWATGVSVFVAWNVGTLVGAIAGRAIGDPSALGLDAAFPAGFVSLMMPQLRVRPKLVAAAVAAAIAAVAVPLVRPGLPVLLAVPAALLALIGAIDDDGAAAS